MVVWRLIPIFLNKALMKDGSCPDCKAIHVNHRDALNDGLKRTYLYPCCALAICKILTNNTAT